MLLKKTNIEEKLAMAKIDTLKSEDLLLEVREILKDNSDNQERIKKNISGGRKVIENQFDFDQLETNKIFAFQRKNWILKYFNS